LKITKKILKRIKMPRTVSKKKSDSPKKKPEEK